MKFAIVFTLLLGSTAFAAGEPDAHFGDGGRLIVQAHESLPFLNPNEPVRGLDTLIDHAGRIVMVGSAAGPDPSGLGANYEFGLVGRYLRDGSPDPQFNDGKLRALGVGFRGFRLYDVAEHMGGLVVYGYTLDYFDWKLTHVPNAPVVCRFDGNGSLDTGFGDGGCQTLESIGVRPALQWLYTSDTSDHVDAIAVQDDGRIVVLGGVRKPDPQDPRSFGLVRLDADGGIDMTFGDTNCAEPAPRCGLVFSPAPWVDNIDPHAISLDRAQDRIVVAGHVTTFDTMFVMRFEHQGDLDLVFDPASFFSQLGVGTKHRVKAVEVLPDSSVALLGTIYQNNANKYVGVARFDGAGHLQVAFGQQGLVLLKDPLSDDFDHLAVDLAPHGVNHLLVAGAMSLDDGFFTELSRLWRIDAATGVLEMSFGDSGLAKFGLDYDPNQVNQETYFTRGVAVGSGDIAIVGTQADPNAEDPSLNPFIFRIDYDKLFMDNFDD